MEVEDPNEWVATVGRPKLVEAAKQSKAVWEKWKPRAGEWLACQFIKQAYQLTLAEATSGTVPRAFKKMENPATALCALRSALCPLCPLWLCLVNGDGGRAGCEE
ncbi:hypothetical protein SDJN02_08866, partial [Cucurbita argyrosperma subsp. argyrosperma]